MNQPVRRNPVVAFLSTTWNVINFTRQLILNLLFFSFLFLFLVIFLLIIMASAGQSLQNGTTLVLVPEGRLVEQYSTDPVTRAFMKAAGDKRKAEIQLRDLLRAIEAAKNDQRISHVYLRVDHLYGGGMASLREVAAALADLRDSGKEVIAFAETLSQGQYLLAAQADELYIDPMGGMLLEGLSSYRQYMREGLEDKLGVQMRLYRVGEYKSAGETFILDAASDDAKEADLFWMNDLWARYLEDIAQARGLDAAELVAAIDNLPEGLSAVAGDLAQYAVQHKWVDGLKTREEMRQLLVQRGVADHLADLGFRNASLDEYLVHIDRERSVFDKRPQVAVVVAEGAITSGEQPPGYVGGESTSEILRQARSDDQIRAVVLRVNSPGGEVFPSEQIRREVAALNDSGKPVVVSMGDVAASGGYWISMNAERIFADPSTISGSIGIFGLVPNFTQTLDKIGIHTDGVGTTRMAGAFDLSKPFDPAVDLIIQSIIENGYANFIGNVADARNMPLEAVDAVARGRVWSGAQAQGHGLIDELGGMRDAVVYAAESAGLGAPGRYQVRYLEKNQSPFSQFAAGFAGSRLGRVLLKDSDFARGIIADRLPGVETQLEFIERATRHDSTLPVTTVAHCFCEF